MKYTFIPLPFYDKQDEQWKPSVKTLVNGEFLNWQVFDLGFDSPKYTMPFAIEFSREIEAMTISIANADIERMMNNRRDWK